LFAVRIRAWQAIAVAVAAIGAASFVSISPAGASGNVTLSPNSGPAGTTVDATASFDGFLGSAPVTLECNNPTDTTTTFVLFDDVQVPSTAFSADSTPPATVFEFDVPADATPGSHTVEVHCDTAGGDAGPVVHDSASSTFTVVPDSTLTLKPAAGLSGTVVDATASFWTELFSGEVDNTGCLSPSDPRFTPTVLFNDSSVDFTVVDDGANSTTFEFTVPVEPVGDYTVEVDCQVNDGDGSRSQSVTADFTVTPFSVDGTLVLSPPAGSAGSFFYATATWPAPGLIGIPVLVDGPFVPSAPTTTEGCFDPTGASSSSDIPVVQFDGSPVTFQVAQNNATSTVFGVFVPNGAALGDTTLSVSCRIYNGDGTSPSTAQATYTVTLPPPVILPTTTTSTTLPPTTLPPTTLPPTTLPPTTLPPTTLPPTTLPTLPTPPPSVLGTVVVPTTVRPTTTVPPTTAPPTTVPPTTTTAAPTTTTTTAPAATVTGGSNPPAAGPTTTLPPKQPDGERSNLVRSVRSIDDINISLKTVGQNVLLALLILLLIAFPSDLFNSTLLANYDEVRGWFGFHRFDRFSAQLRRLPSSVTLLGFAVLGALVMSQMSTNFGLNKGSLALALGLFVAFLTFSAVYDVARGMYMRRRFGDINKLAAHPVGLMIGILFVLVSRLAHFAPGYIYGLFTALRFQQAPDEKAEGRGLALASVAIGVLGFLAWLLWGPIHTAAAKPGVGFGTLWADATLSTLWIISLGAIAFGLAPMRFMYGESVKKWSVNGWRFIWGLGLFVFVTTVLHPEEGFYGSSTKTSLASILAIFIAFGVFSVVFWGYFRYRHLWRGQPDELETAVETEVN
jgi:hypothetical protein